MKKQVIMRSIIGIPIGVTISYLITIIISIILGEGTYSAVVPILAEKFGSEISAVVFQTVLSALLGAVFAASSVIWEIEQWSIAKQTAIYFSITAATMLPIAYFTQWMENSLMGFVIYFLMFSFIFVIVWFIQYAIFKHKIKKISIKVKSL